MRLISEYLERAAHFERMAGQTADPKLRRQLLEQSEAYWKLATKRAAEVGVPAPVKPASSR